MPSTWQCSHSTLNDCRYRGGMFQLSCPLSDLPQRESGIVANWIEFINEVKPYRSMAKLKKALAIDQYQPEVIQRHTSIFEWRSTRGSNKSFPGISMYDNCDDQGTPQQRLSARNALATWLDVHWEAYNIGKSQVGNVHLSPKVDSEGRRAHNS